MRRASIRFGQLAGNIRRYSEKHDRDQGHIASRLKRILPDFEHRPTTRPPQVEAGHGQIETRTATVSAGVAWLQQQRQRPGLQAAGKVVRMRETAEKAATETAYDLLSKPLAPERLNEVARQRRGVENSLHWRLDAVMNQDRQRTRMGHWPHNLAVMRRMAINAMQP